MVLLVATDLGGALALPLGVALIAFLMCVQANWKPLAFIPAAFAGYTAVFRGAGNWLNASIALVLGAFFGFISEAAAAVLTRTRRESVVAPL